jgi:hypothetical protein
MAGPKKIGGENFCLFIIKYRFKTIDDNLDLSVVYILALMFISLSVLLYMKKILKIVFANK